MEGLKKEKQALILTAEKDREDKLLWSASLPHQLQRHAVKNAITSWKDGVRGQPGATMAANESN